MKKTSWVSNIKPSHKTATKTAMAAATAVLQMSGKGEKNKKIRAQ